MKSEAWDSMNRVRGLLAVARCFAAKGVEKDDVPAWIAGTFETLLDVIRDEVDIAVAEIDREAKPADGRPDA
ncbi:MAG: hypothetical protein M3178_10630 [Pseudomonadota bacterium]|nr:hypothetical protein [Pseudomonadota bacterium]